MLEVQILGRVLMNDLGISQDSIHNALAHRLFDQSDSFPFGRRQILEATPRSVGNVSNAVDDAGSEKSVHLIVS